MNISQLKTIIHQIVKEEVKSELNKILLEIVMNKQPNVPVTGTSSVVNEVKASSNNPKIVTKNPMLNKVLNNTGFTEREKKMMNDAAMNIAPTFKKIGVNDHLVPESAVKQPTSVLSQLQSMVGTVDEIKQQDGESVLDNVEALPPVLQNAFNRDYRGFMKLVNNKLNDPGSMNSSRVGMDTSAS